MRTRVFWIGFCAGLHLVDFDELTPGPPPLVGSVTDRFAGHPIGL